MDKINTLLKMIIKVSGGKIRGICSGLAGRCRTKNIHFRRLGHWVGLIRCWNLFFHSLANRWLK